MCTFRLTLQRAGTTKGAQGLGARIYHGRYAALPPTAGPPLAPMTNIFFRRQDRNHRKSSDSTLATTQTLYRRWGIKTAREYARIKIGPPARQRQPGLRQRARARPCRRTLLRPAARLRARSWEIAPPGSTPNPNMF